MKINWFQKKSYVGRSYFLFEVSGRITFHANEAIIKELLRIRQTARPDFDISFKSTPASSFRKFEQHEFDIEINIEAPTEEDGQALVEHILKYMNYKS